MKKIVVCGLIDADDLKNWYKVSIDERERPMSGQYVGWIIDNVSSNYRWAGEGVDYNRIDYYFENEDDAVAFKLRWL